MLNTLLSRFSGRKRKSENILIWKSIQDPVHYLILLPKHNTWGTDTFNFLRIDLDPSQIGLQMRFRHSQKLPWRSSDYVGTCTTLNPLAEATVEPVKQYLSARADRNESAIAQFHQLVFRLHDRITKELARLEPTSSGIPVADYSSLEVMLETYDRAD